MHKVGINASIGAHLVGKTESDKTPTTPISKKKTPSPAMQKKTIFLAFTHTGYHRR